MYMSHMIVIFLRNCIISNGVNFAGHVEVGEYAIIGGLTAVQQFVRIGAHSFISGASKVRKDIPPYVKAARDPISYVGDQSYWSGTTWLFT